MKSSRIATSSLLSASVLALAMLAQSAYAIPFTITSQLTGDPRTANPDNLIVDVTITGDDTSNIVTWLVDINSPLHTDIKLDAFYFNMVGPASLYSFSAFSPSSWAVSTPAINATGSGGANFMFVANDPPPGPVVNVTNSVDLSFTMTKTSSFLITDFTNASDAVSSDAVLGSGQLGAHLQSLTPTGSESDSGFAFGGYDGGGGGPPQQVPEPAMLLLMGAGLLGLGLARRRKSA